MSDKLLPDSVDKALGSAVTPLANNLGTTMGNLWFMVFGWLDHKADKRRAKYAVELQKYQTELEKALSEIPEDRRIDPNTQIAMSALSASQFCVEEPELREMFCKLLASTTDSPRAGQAHPLFPSIIQRMSSADAVLLKKLNSPNKFPVVRYTLSKQGEDGFIVVAENVLAIDDNVLENVAETSASLSVLASLGLIELTYFHALTRNGAYQPFEHCSFYIDLLAHAKSEFGNTASIKIERGTLMFTDIGKQFYSVCVEP